MEGRVSLAGVENKKLDQTGLNRFESVLCPDTFRKARYNHKRCPISAQYFVSTHGRIVARRGADTTAYEPGTSPIESK